MSSVCFPISFLHVQSGCGMEVGVKHFYGQEMKARMASKKQPKLLFSQVEQQRARLRRAGPCATSCSPSSCNCPANANAPLCISFCIQNLPVWKTCLVMWVRKERVTVLNKQITSVCRCSFFLLLFFFSPMQSGALGVMPIETRVCVAAGK